MTNIQPFEYQQRTNIEEHNQLVDKVNEIVAVINDVNLDTINTNIDNLEIRADKTDSDLATVQAKDIIQDSEIADLKPRVAMTETEVTNLKTRADKIDSDLATVQAKDITQDSEIDAISKSLVSNVVMSDGTTMGSVQVSIEREDGALITSKNYKWGRDIGIRLEAGTQAGYVKAVIDLSDGTILESNEYRIVEVLESDIYVTAITLVANQTDGTLGGNISYSNGTTQSINTVSVPTAPGVTTALDSLQSRMTAVEQKNTTQDGQITALDTRVKAIEDTPGVGQFDTGKLGTIAGSTIDGRVKAESDGTGSVNGWSVLKDRITAVEQKNTSQDGDISSINSEINGLKSKNTEQDNSIAGKVAISQGTENAGKSLIVGDDGNVKLGDIAGGKKLYTGPITDLIVRGSDNVVISKEFTIEYLILSPSEKWTGNTFVTVEPCVLPLSSMYIAYATIYGHLTSTNIKELNCAIKSDSYNGIIVQNPSGEIFTQLTSSLPSNPSVGSKYYRLYV